MEISQNKFNVNMRLNIKILITLNLFSFIQDNNNFRLKAQVLQWAYNFGAYNSDNGNFISSDDSANIYTMGTYYSGVDFDPGPGTYNLNSVGPSTNIFISKIDRLGNFSWAISIGGGINQVGNSMAIDRQHNVYITGCYNGATDFDSGWMSSYIMTPIGNYDIFIAKYDSSGNFLWAKSIGGPWADNGSSIALDSLANIFITGSFQGTGDFDPGAGIFSLNGGNSDNMFISKLDSNGSLIWAKMIYGSSSASGNNISLDKSNNIVTSGTFSGTVDFDPGLSVFNLVSMAGSQDVFISKLDSSGNFIWAKSIGSVNNDYIYSLTVDNLSNICFTGWFISTLDFDPGLGVYLLSPMGSQDTFVEKLDSSGNFMWSKQFGGTMQNGGLSLTIDVLGNIYTTGFFQGITDFDPGIGVYNMNSSTWGAFISKLNSNGNFVWAKSFGTGSIPSSNSITIDNLGNIYTLGSFSSTSDFDPGNGIYNLTSFGNSDIFLQKLGICNYPPASPLSINGPTSICPGYVIGFHAVPGGVVSDTYTWSLPIGWIGSSTTNDILVTVGTASGSIFVTENNSCGSSAPTGQIITVLPQPLPPGPINGNTTICTGSSNTYSISPVPGAVSYSWVLPSGWTGFSITTSINTISGISSGSISVIASNGVCNSTPQMITVMVEAMPLTPSNISGNQNICSGSVNSYYTPPIVGLNYTWTLPTGWAGSSIFNYINTVAGLNSDTIFVSANNTCGSSGSQSLYVNVTPSFALISISAFPNDTICQGDIVSFTSTITNGGAFPSYQWKLNGNNVGLNSNNYTASSLIDGDVVNCILTSSLACVSGNPAISNSISITVIPNPSVPIITEQVAGILHSSALSGNQWYLNMMTIPFATGQNYLYTQSGNYSVTSTISGCSASSSYFQISLVNNLSQFENKNSDIFYFPNPSSDGKFNLVFQSYSLPDLELEIYNILGEKVFEKAEFENKDNTIDLSKEVSGMYFVIIYSKERILFSKIVIQK